MISSVATIAVWNSKSVSPASNTSSALLEV
jgi:hypothetical protein